MTKERWTEIEGFPNYAVSSRGRIWNLGLNKEVHPYLDSYGYVRVNLRDERGKPYTRFVHRLVVMHFIENTSKLHPKSGIQWKDGDCTNNNVENLYVKYRFDPPRVVRHVKVPLVRKLKVYLYGPDHPGIEVYANVEEFCKYYMEHPKHVHAVLNGSRKLHKGMYFEYIWERFE